MPLTLYFQPLPPQNPEPGPSSKLGAFENLSRHVHPYDAITVVQLVHTRRVIWERAVDLVLPAASPTVVELRQAADTRDVHPEGPATYTPKAELRELTESPVAHRASYAVDEGASATVVFAETEPPTDEESTVTVKLIVAGACGDAAC